MLRYRCRREIAATLLLVALGILALLMPPIASAQTQSAASISGTLVDVGNGLGVSNAEIELWQGGKVVTTKTSDQNGTFHFTNLAPGVYQIAVRAQGYQIAHSGDIALVPGSGASVGFSLQRAPFSSGMRTIGRTSTQVQSLQTSATITRTLSTELLQRENYLRIGDALQTLPGVNLHGLSTTISDDQYVDIRGLKVSETQTLLDGHPIGPIGVFAGQTSGGFNYQDSPTFAIANTQVTFGSGATGLYGVTEVCGTVDLQSINPTPQFESFARQGIGDQGRMFTLGQMSGTISKLGYALVYGVQGAYGIFPGQMIEQTGLRAGDLTSATAQGLTNHVSGDYNVRNSLAKLRYDISPVTQLTLTNYTANSWNDKTGEGDNDFNTYEYELNNANKAASNIAPGCTAAAPFQITSDSGSFCGTPAEYAATTTGPAGGGGGAWQAIGNQDYHARLTSTVKKHNVVLDSFIDNYAVIYHRSPSFIQGGLQVNTSRYRTYGTLISDDIPGEKNDFGFGYYNQHQRIFGDDIDNATNQMLAQRPVLGQTFNNVFIRDVYQFTPRFSAFANAWLEHALTVNQASSTSAITTAPIVQSLTTFDPRLSLVYRPTGRDVVRFTAGIADGMPAPTTTTFGAAAAINPGNCQQFTVGTISNGLLSPEHARDLEFAVGHRFLADTALSVDLYDTNETNYIFLGNVPLAPYLGLIGAAQYNSYVARVQKICPTDPNPTIDQFNVSTSLNAAAARAKGIEVAGRYRFTPRFFIDGTYDVQSTALFDISDAILMRNVTYINGAQVPGIPLQKVSLSLDWAPGSFEFRLDNYWVGNNNALNRPPYLYSNLALTRTFGRLTANLGMQNVFNGVYQQYGLIGAGVFIPENQFGSDTSGLDQGTERFGLTPRSFQLWVQARM